MAEKTLCPKLNRNQIKYIVIIAMLIDHIAWGFVDSVHPLIGGFMHLFGRLTGATMAYFVGEGYRYTRNVSKYQIRLAVFTVISWFPFVYFEFGKPDISQSVIYTLFLGLTAIRVWESPKFKKPQKKILITFLCLLSMIGDWAFMNVLGILFVHIYRNEPKKKWRAFTLIYLVPNIAITILSISERGLKQGLLGTWFQFGVLLVPLMLKYLYNGESGSKAKVHKWFFYLFYPIHLLILGFLRWGI